MYTNKRSLVNKRTFSHSFLLEEEKEKLIFSAKEYINYTSFIVLSFIYVSNQ